MSNREIPLLYPIRRLAFIVGFLKGNLLARAHVIAIAQRSASFLSDYAYLLEGFTMSAFLSSRLAIGLLALFSLLTTVALTIGGISLTRAGIVSVKTMSGFSFPARRTTSRFT